MACHFRLSRQSPAALLLGVRSERCAVGRLATPRPGAARGAIPSGATQAVSGECGSRGRRRDVRPGRVPYLPEPLGTPESGAISPVVPLFLRGYLEPGQTGEFPANSLITPPWPRACATYGGTKGTKPPARGVPCTRTAGEVPDCYPLFFSGKTLSRTRDVRHHETNETRAARRRSRPPDRTRRRPILPDNSPQDWNGRPISVNPSRPFLGVTCVTCHLASAGGAWPVLSLFFRLIRPPRGAVIRLFPRQRVKHRPRGGVGPLLLRCSSTTTGETLDLARRFAERRTVHEPVLGPARSGRSHQPRRPELAQEHEIPAVEPDGHTERLGVP